MSVVALVLGRLVVALLGYRTRLQLRVAFHRVRHLNGHIPWSRDGRVRAILAATSPAPAEFGFTGPTTVTLDAPCADRRYSKRDAIPVHVIEMLLPHDADGRRLGSSLFIDDGETPALRAARKERYLLGVRAVDVPAAVREAVAANADATDTDTTTLDEYALRVCVDATARLHAGAPADAAVRDGMVATCRALTVLLNDPWSLAGPAAAWAAKPTLRAFVRGATGGMIAAWRAAGMPEDDLYAEFAHNLFGMTVQWAYVLCQLCLDPQAWIATVPDAARYLLRDPPATVAASRCPVTDGLVLHDLESRCRRATLPDDPVGSSSSVHLHEDVADYLVFGCGARRCPGEWMSYEFVVAAAAAPLPTPTRSQGTVLLGVRAVPRATVSRG